MTRLIYDNARLLEKIAEADRRFFASFPNRKFLLRRTSPAEREQQDITGGSRPRFAIVHQVMPGIRIRLYIAGRKFSPDLAEMELKSLWEEAVRSHPEVRRIEAELRKAFYRSDPSNRQTRVD